MNRRVLNFLLLSATIVLLTGAQNAYSQGVNWVNPGVGDWTNPANWMPPGPPTSSDQANIVNGGTATLGFGKVGVYALLTIFSGNVLISGGSLSGGVTVIGLGSSSALTLQDGTWTNSLQTIVGFGANGSLTISGGVANLPLLDIGGLSALFGSSVSGDGIMMVSGGILNAQVVNLGGPVGRGIYNHSSGTANIGTLNVGVSGGAIFSLSGGQVTANTVNIALQPGISFGAMFLTGGTLSTQSITGQADAVLLIDGSTLQALADAPNFISGFSANNITIGNNGAVIDNNGFQIGIMSPLTGTGGLTLFSPGTLILAADNTYTGDTILTAGTLQLGNGGVSGSVMGNIINNGTLVINRSGNVTFPQMISGQGDVTINSPGGVINFSTNQTYTGATTIYAGQLSVNAQLASLNVLINPNGILSGIGTLAGNVVNSGLLSPGTSPGVITIHGNYTQSNYGTLLIQLAGENAYDQVAVGGTANLNGTLQVEFLNGFVPDCGSEFTILTAQKGVSGTFTTVNFPEDQLEPFVIYDPFDVKLLFPTSEVLIQSIAQGTLDPNLFGQGILEQLSPRIAATVKDIAFNVANTQYGQITERLAAMRAGVGGMVLQGINQEPMVEQLRKRESKLGKSVVYQAQEVSPWSIFASAAGVFSKMTTASDLPRLHSTTGYFSVGADCQMSSHINAGIYAGYQGMKSWYSEGSLLRANGMKFGMYGTAQWNGFTQWDDFYINAIVGGGANFYNLNRSLNIGGICGQSFQAIARGNPFGGELDSLLGGGYEFNLGNWRFGANSSLQYTYLGISSFTESGANAVNARVDSQNPSSLVYSLGVNVAYLWDPVPGFRILPTVGISWQHEFLNYGQRIHAALNGGSGINVPFNSATGARNYAFGVAGIAAQLGPRFSAYGYYNPQFGGGQIISHGALVGLSYNF